MGVLRLFLAVSVLVLHLRWGRGVFGLTLLNGTLAVECFFVISGFYMALVLNEKYNYLGSYWDFIQQRFLRLYPLYLLSLILLLAAEGLVTYVTSQPCGIFQTWTNTPHWTNPLTSCFCVLVNITMLGLDSLRFLNEDLATGQLSLAPPGPGRNWGTDYIVNAPSWTLAVEMTFYLLAPFLVRRSFKLQAGVLLASLALRSAFFWTLGPMDSGRWTYSFFPSVLCFFMAGSLGYRVYKSYGAEMQKFAASHAWIFWVFFAFMLDPGRLPLKDYYFWIFSPLSVVMVPLLFAYTRNNKRDRLIGELSFPFYLVHFPVVAIVELFLHGKYTFLFGPLSIVITFGVAYFLYRVVEARTEHFRERLFQKRRPAKNQRRVTGLPASVPESP
jgi:peptidoglycan/LPS O-acetylase OafA/YrhL